MLRESHKLTELDALRGIAAVIVFSGHFCEGLVPAVTASINGTVLFSALNGPASVILFFVLSGFVLALRPLRTGRMSAVLPLALKRWPRLAGPVAVAGLAYALASTARLFPRPEWFAAPPNAPAYLFWGAAQHSEDLGDVLREALFDTFARESARHNGVLWTMHWELLGSFLSLGLAGVTLLKLPVAARTLLFGGVWAAAAAYSPWLIAFPLGVLGAAIHRGMLTHTRIGSWWAITLVICGVILLSWDIRARTGIWRWTDAIPAETRVSLWVVTESVAAALLMSVALYHPRAKRFLSGRVGALAGRMSFAFYLIHLLVLCSISSCLVIWIGPAGMGLWAGAGLFGVSISAAGALAFPLMMFDQWWIRVLERASRPLVRASTEARGSETPRAVR